MSDSRFNWLLLATMMVASFLTGIGNRIFGVSLPTISASLGTDLVGISWAVIAFQIGTIGFSLVFGRLGDLYGRRRIHALGLVVFTAGTLIGAFAQNLPQLMVCRLSQGLGAALIQSQGRVLAMQAVPRSASGKAQGFITTAHNSGFLLGPSLGGFVIESFSWRAIFVSTLPVGIAGIFLAWLNHTRSGAEIQSSRNPKRASVDYLGAVLLVLVTLSLVVTLDRRVAQVMPWGWRAACSTLLVVSFAGFIGRERTTASPILDLTLFRIPLFVTAASCLLLFAIVQSITIFLLPFYLQEVLDLSPSFMGILFMSAPLFTVILSPFGGALADRYGPRLPTTAGALLLGLASCVGMNLGVESHWALPALMLAIGGLAGSLFFPPNHTTMIGSVPERNRGVATGSVVTLFGLSNVLGIALANILMSAAFKARTGLATPNAANASAFVGALNVTFGVAAFVAFLGFAFCWKQPGKRWRYD